MGTILEILALGILIAFAAVTAASEISMIAASRLRLKRMASEGSKAAQTILKMLEAPERFFGTILVANNIVGAFIASLVTAMIIRAFGGSGSSVLAATLVASFLIIVSEVAAKTFAAKHSERTSLVLARPLRILIKLLHPVVQILEVITNKIVSLVDRNQKGKPTLVTDEELRALVKISAEDNAPSKDKYKMLSRVFDFSETLVKSVMTPIKDMVAINMNTAFEDVLENVIESGYSRIPVYKDSPENITGVINAKDLLNITCNRSLVVMHDIINPAVVVNSSKKVTELLKEFQKGHTHIAIVKDDKGNIEGLVTLEDLIEEIVGEIEDEYDIRSNPSSTPK